MLGRDAALKLKEKESIEVVPLAYMRGRTLDNSFIIPVSYTHLSGEFEASGVFR